MKVKDRHVSKSIKARRFLLEPLLLGGAILFLLLASKPWASFQGGSHRLWHSSIPEWPAKPVDPSPSNPSSESTLSPNLTPADEYIPNDSLLPVFDLTIPPSSIKALNDALPQDDRVVADRQSIFAGVSDNKWPFVPAVFTYNGRKYDVKIRFRGWNYDHYMLRKKSWRIKFSRDDPFFGRREINVANIRERAIINDVFEHDLLRDMGQLLPDEYLVHMRVNGEFSGVQVAFEQPDDEFLERHEHTVGGLFGERMHSKDPFQSITMWQQYVGPPSDYQHLERLRSRLEDIESDPKELLDLLDLDRFLDFCAESVLTASTNPGRHNWRLYYDPIRQHFVVLPWYQFGVDWPLNARFLRAHESRPVDFMFSLPILQTFRNSHFYDIYHAKLAHLVKHQGHISNLLARANEWRDRVRTATYLDVNKHSVTHFTFEGKYFTNQEWEDAIEEFKTCLVVRSEYTKRFLNDCRTTANISPHSMSLSSGIDIRAKLSFNIDGYMTTHVEAFNLGWKSPPGDVHVFYDKNRDGVLSAGDIALDPVPGDTSETRHLLSSGFRGNRISARGGPDLYSEGGPGEKKGLVMLTEPVEVTFFIGAKPPSGTPNNQENVPKLVSVEATNAITGQALPPEPIPNFELTTIETPLAVASDSPVQGPGYRLDFYTYSQSPLSVDWLEFEWPGNSPRNIKLIQEIPLPSGAVEERVLAQADLNRDQAQVKIPLNLEVKGRLDPWPASDPLGPVMLPQITEILVRVRGGSTAHPLPRLLTAFTTNPSTRMPASSQITRAPNLNPFPVQHSAPNFDPVPPGQVPHMPRIEHTPPTQHITWEDSKHLTEDLDLEPSIQLTIKPGTKVSLDPGVSLRVRGQLIAKGTAKQPIHFIPSLPGQSWGAIAVDSAAPVENIFSHCIFQSGSMDSFGSLLYSGALSVYNCSALIEHCQFIDNTGDDGINCKYSDSILRHCFFKGNQDAIDYDFTGGEITACNFTDNLGDSIDLSGVTTLIRDNMISGSEDKGISVGERSNPIIFNNVITDCTMGIAVKDSSNALVLNNTVVNNRTGISLYIKKNFFGPPHATLVGSIFWNNDEEAYVGENSTLTADLSIFSSPAGGPGSYNADAFLALTPVFYAPDQGDFRLHPDSPGRNAGDGRPLSQFSPALEGSLLHLGADLDPASTP